ncbi:MAG: hypothetical protein M0R46_00005 [Candidatus Muirbacterium halophilum]|nr:hypothetical protein [Candidatus Muirbacterium halophilum]MCK9474275.1 hypothetical protein [Candidatus Muirbacterium halophilum]
MVYKKSFLISVLLVAVLLFGTGCGSSKDSPIDNIVTSISGYLFKDSSSNPAPSNNNAPKISSNDIEEISLEFAGITKIGTIDSDGFFRIDLKNSDILGSNFIDLLGNTANLSDIKADELVKKYLPKINIKIKGAILPSTIVLPVEMLQKNKATVLPRVILKKEGNSYKYKVEDENGLNILSDGGQFIDGNQTNYDKVALIISKFVSVDGITGDIIDTSNLKQKVEDKSTPLKDNDLISRVFIENVSEDESIIYKFATDTYERIIYIKGTNSGVYKVEGEYKVEAGKLLITNKKINNIAYSSLDENLIEITDVKITEEVNIYANNSGLRIVDKDEVLFFKEIFKITKKDLKEGEFFAPDNILKQKKSQDIIVISDENNNEGISDSFNYGIDGIDFFNIQIEDEINGSYCLELYDHSVQIEMYMIGNLEDNVEIFTVEYDGVYNNSGPNILNLNDFYFDYISKTTPKKINQKDFENKIFFVKDLLDLNEISIYDFKSTDYNNDFSLSLKNMYIYRSFGSGVSDDIHGWELNKNLLKIGFKSWCNIKQKNIFDLNIDVCIDKTLAKDNIKGATYTFSKNLIMQEFTKWNDLDIKNKIYAVYNDKDEIMAYFDFTENNEKVYEDYKWKDINSKFKISDNYFELKVWENLEDENTNFRKFYRLGKDDNNNIIAVYVDFLADFKTKYNGGIGNIILKEISKDKLPQTISDNKQNIENLLKGKTFINKFYTDYSTKDTKDSSYGGIISFNDDYTYKIIGQGLSYKATVNEYKWFDNFYNYKEELGNWEVDDSSGKVTLTYGNDEIFDFEIDFDKIAFDEITIVDNDRFGILSEMKNTTMNDLKDGRFEFAILNLDETIYTEEFKILLDYEKSGNIELDEKDSDTTLDYINFAIVDNTVNLTVYPNDEDNNITRNFKFYKSRVGYYVEYYENNNLKSVRYISILVYA